MQVTKIHGRIAAHMACIGHAYTFRQQTCAIMQVSRAYAAISVGTPMACKDISHFSSLLCATKSPNHAVTHI